MKRMKMVLVLSAVATCALLTAGCSKDEKKDEKTTTTAAKVESKNAEGKKKLPPQASAKKKEHGKKGGDGAQTPSDKSHKASSTTTHAPEGKKKKAAGDNPCEHLPDGVAECSGKTLLVCADKELWAVDCDGLMTSLHPELFTAGTCFETDTVTDCLGVGVAEDGVVESCTSDLALCCDEDGNCAAH